MDEKKKLAILGVLGATIVAVGAFQLVSGGAEPQPVKQTKKVVSPIKGDDKKEVKNALAMLELPARDPFKPAALAAINVPAPTAAQLGTLPLWAKANRKNPAAELPPFQIDKSGSLPNPTVGPMIATRPDFGYGLSGVILGSRPAAVFTDGQGGQRLVPVGGSLDGDTRVMGIEKGAVTVSFRGKTIRISGGIGK